MRQRTKKRKEVNVDRKKFKIFYFYARIQSLQKNARFLEKLSRKDLLDRIEFVT